MIGCSSKLMRREAKHQIDAMLKPRAVGTEKQIVPGGVPGFDIGEMHSDTTTFTLDDHKEYGNVIGLSHMPRVPDSEGFLLNALSRLGYVTIEQDGPKVVMAEGSPWHYAQSRTVRLTPKVGTARITLGGVEYSTGFTCHPVPPNFCALPPLAEADEEQYEITGISQDDIHARVSLSIPWKLTQLGRELKPFAEQVEKEAVDDAPMDNNAYNDYPALYDWEHFLNSHADAGSSPATVLFQKFDDGWRIVDENGKSEKDFR
jgi:hypothetical protein